MVEVGRPVLIEERNQLVKNLIDALNIQPAPGENETGRRRRTASPVARAGGRRMATSQASVVVREATSTQPPARLAFVPLAQMWRVGAFLAHLAPLAAAGVVYELLRGVFQHRGTVHVGDLFELEARLFSVRAAGGPRALSEVIARASSPWLDALCGVTYFLFLVEVVAAATYLFFARSRAHALELTLGFFLVNVGGWSLWLVYPAAPPWYVDQYGMGPAILDVVSSPGGLARVDAWLGVPLATTFYSKSANVFGAMPSLHVAYATLVAWVAGRAGGWLRVATLLFAASMALSAVYLRHHYILDVLAGMALALLVGAVIRVLLERAAFSKPTHGINPSRERA
jgi:membrane-associated phospholipid phosphatase